MKSNALLSLLTAVVSALTLVVFARVGFLVGNLEDSRIKLWIVATVIGLMLLTWRTVSANIVASSSVKQLDLSRKGYITNRFSKAVELLSSQSSPAITGGIYALESICQVSAQ